MGTTTQVKRKTMFVIASSCTRNLEAEIKLDSFVIGFGRQVHFSHRINIVMRSMALPETLNTVFVELVLKIEYSLHHVSDVLLITCAGGFFFFFASRRKVLDLLQAGAG